MALLSLSSPGTATRTPDWARTAICDAGRPEGPDGALVVGLDRASIGWLQRNINALDRVSHGLEGCLPPQAREGLSRARNISQVPRALHACLIRRLAERSPRLIVFDINFNSETSDDLILAEAVRSAGNVLLLDRIEGDGLVRRLGPSAPLADAAKETVFFQTDGTPGRIVTGYPTRSRFFSDHSGHAARSLASSRRPRDRRDPHSMPDFQLIWLYGPAGAHPHNPDRACLRGGRVRASARGSRDSPCSSVPPCIRPILTITSRSR